MFWRYCKIWINGVKLLIHGGKIIVDKIKENIRRK